MNKITDAFYRLRSLSVYRGILKRSVVAAFSQLLEAAEKSPKEFLDAYCGFYSLLCERGFGGNFAYCLTETALFDENCFTRAATSQTLSDLPENVIAAAKNDCASILFLSGITGGDILDAYKYREQLGDVADGLPRWECGLPAEPFRQSDLMSALCRFHRENGCGMFARYKAFVWRKGGIRPVVNHDKITLGSLKGYEYQRRLIVDNTRAFLDGKTCNNCLLYGDKGTGKSSTVKAVGNYFRREGLRIVEIPKERLMDFPLLVDVIASIPMKFIIFIDDLSFLQQDESYASLKAVLEGGLAARPDNALIYATSNRRHLIKERFSDRDDDDVNRRDNMEESLSLSDRFGLSVCFSVPTKDKFLDIVLALAEQYGVKESEENLCAGAERFALERGGRSPRCAKQYIESLFN